MGGTWNELQAQVAAANGAVWGAWATLAGAVASAAVAVVAVRIALAQRQDQLRFRTEDTEGARAALVSAALGAIVVIQRVVTEACSGAISTDFPALRAQLAVQIDRLEHVIGRARHDTLTVEWALEARQLCHQIQERLAGLGFGAGVNSVLHSELSAHRVVSAMLAQAILDGRASPGGGDGLAAAFGGPGPGSLVSAATVARRPATAP